MPDADAVAESWNALGERLASVFQAVSTPYALLTPDLRFVTANAAYADVTGREIADLIGLDLFEAFPENPALVTDDSEANMRASLDRVLASGTPDVLPLIRYDTIEDGEFTERFWHVSNTPILDADGQVELIVVHPEEVTTFLHERLRLQARGNMFSTMSPSQAQAVDGAFTAAVSRLQNLSDLASALVGASSPQEVGRAVMRDGLLLAGAAAGSLVTVTGGRCEMVASAAHDVDLADRWSAFAVTAGRDPFSDVILSGEPRFHASRTAFIRQYPDLADELAAHHHSWAVLPLRNGTEISGAIGLVYNEPNAFDTPLRLVLYTLANLVSQATSRALLLEEQATALHSVETTFQPLIEPIDGVDVTHLYHPATIASGAGGDFYDVIDLDDDASLVVIGDVANHGALAIGEMARARSTLHALALEGHAPDVICSRADLTLARFANTHTTCIVARLDHRDRTITWTNAGHPFPILRSANGDTELLDETHGTVLSVGTGGYTSNRRRLELGDTIVFYTDGLIESPSHSGIDEGFEHACHAVAATSTCDDLATALYERMQPTARHDDDIAILTLRIAPTSSV